MIPDGATHYHEFYHGTYYFKLINVDHLNQVSEEWQIIANWYFWTGKNWQLEKEHPRLVKPLK